MGTTSTRVKNAWTNRNYERITITVKKGEKENLRTAASAAGVSVNRFIIDCINASAGDILSALDDESKRRKNV